MIVSNLKALIARKEQLEGRSLSYRVISEETGLSTTTITKVATNSFANIGRSTLDSLCQYFQCGVGDLLEYLPDSPQK